MGKIGQRIYFTYFILLIIFFIIASISFNLLSKRYIRSETKEKLKIEAMEIQELLKRASLENISANQQLLVKRKLKVAGKFIDADILVFNTKNQLIYPNRKHINEIKLNEIKNRKILRDKYIIINRPIINKKGESKGKLVLYTDIDELYSLISINRRARQLSFLIAGIIALAIAKILENTVTNPIRLLNKKMQSFTLFNQSNNDEIGPIRTGDEIEMLDNSFQSMTEQIKGYNLQMKDFFQNSSHELKTPLMSIQGYAEAIKEGVIEGEDIEKSLDIIIEESQRLKNIVNDLLLLSKAEYVEEHYNFQYHNIEEIIKEAIKTIKPLGEKKGINIETSIKNPGKIYCDRDKLLRAFINILSNGIRYSYRKLEVKIIEDSSKIEVYIIDDGPGIEGDNLNRVFEKFYKGKDGGTGLGLAITKSIIEGHKGKVNVYNNEIQGASFQVELPIYRSL